LALQKRKMSQGEANPWVIGVDVGGTKVATGLVNYRGEILKQTRVPMNCHGTAREGFAAVTSAIDEVLKNLPESNRATLQVGVCAPGPLDPLTGTVLNPPNVPCWRNFPLAAEIAKRYTASVKIDKDANAAALAEGLWGAGHGYKNVFYTCIGTGIGTAFLFNGSLYHGRTGASGEGGHITIDYNGPRCGCGKKGCIEVLASGTAIGRKARARLSEEPSRSSVMLEMAGGNLEAVNSEIVGRAYAAGDPLARKILLETVELLAIWLGNIVDILEPDVIVVGGGVASMLAPLFEDIRRRLPDWCVNCRCLEIPIVPAHYGENAGIAGAAALCVKTATNGFADSHAEP